MLGPFRRNPYHFFKHFDDMFYDMNRGFSRDFDRFFQPARYNRHRTHFFDDPFFEDHHNIMSNIERQFHQEFAQMQRQFIKDFETRVQA